MSNNNSFMNNAKKQKNDEFYTQISDIEKELSCYWNKKSNKIFKNKIIYCNCDNKTSKFYEYFKSHFDELELKQIICTSYNSSGFGERIDFYKNDLGFIEKITNLNGNGDFKSDECISILKSSDIIVSNPPFSLFESYLKLLIESSKKFLIIGNSQAPTIKSLFPYFKNNKVWVGETKYNSGMFFIVPSNAEDYTKIDETGNKLKRIASVCWFTNLDVKRKNTSIPLTKKYFNEDGTENIKEYPKYINYDAININSLKDIPNDYFDKMGVPFTIFGKLNPKQFEIIDLLDSKDRFIPGCTSALYPRIIIKRKKTRSR